MGDVEHLAHSRDVQQSGLPGVEELWEPLAENLGVAKAVGESAARQTAGHAQLVERHERETVVGGARRRLGVAPRELRRQPDNPCGRCPRLPLGRRDLGDKPRVVPRARAGVVSRRSQERLPVRHSRLHEC